MDEKIGDGWYLAQRVADGIWRISDHGQDNIYLVLGEQAALLIDTGWGVGNLPAFVTRLTPLPLIVANTHGHVDHALGNDLFDRLWIAERDGRELDPRGVTEKRAWIRDNLLLVQVQEPPRFNLWGTGPRAQTLELRNGMRIELGGRTVTALLTPGHTGGSACFLDPACRVLFAGDSFVPLAAWGPMWFHLQESQPLSVYYEAMSKVLTAGGFDHLLSGHGERDLIPAGDLASLLRGIRDVIDGKSSGVPEHTFAGDGLRIDFQDAGIVYDPGKLES
jgi:glyoxylase-like metal-dependent hydrolase (beta-lactamase superfamily II)